jgi:predicted nucleic acid-binding protein
MVFVDTSAFFAWYVRRDALHPIAVKHFRELEESRLITTNQRFYAPNPIDIVHTDRLDESAAIAFFRKFADQRVGFTDCISFAVMRRYGIRTAFTFDRNFVDAGFRVIGVE